MGKVSDFKAGTAKLQQQIESGMSEEAIRASWQPNTSRYLEIRSSYLLYSQPEIS